jgi:hypothetical protein
MNRTEHPLAGQVPPGEQSGFDRRHDRLLVRQAALPDFARGQRAFDRLEDGHAARPQLPDVILHRRVVPHAAVHGRRHDQRAARRQGHRAQQVVAEPERQPGQRVGRGGRDDEQIGLFRQGQVKHLLMRGEQVGGHRLAGQHFKGQRGHELRRGLRHDNGHVGAFPQQRAQQFDRLVGGDAAGDAQQDAPAGKGPVRGLVHPRYSSASASAGFAASST